MHESKHEAYELRGMLTTTYDSPYATPKISTATGWKGFKSMARILYGVMGDSRGHLSRSLSVAQAMEQHEFLFLGGGAVHDLKALGYTVEDVPMLATYYRNTRLDLPGTVGNALRILCRKRHIVERVTRIIKAFDPHLIITDYEYFLPQAARSLGLPCYSVDHQHVLTNCLFEPPSGQWLNRQITSFPIRHLYSAADKFLVSSFYQLPPKDPTRTEVYPPVLRRLVKQFHPRRDGHVLVYTSGGAYELLLSFLERIDMKFIIYGFGDRPPRRNLVFKKHSEQGFLEDLVGCLYVISNGGHSLISESLYYGKPVICFPIHFLYEQYLNGYFLEEYGYGKLCMDMKTGHSVIERMGSEVDSFHKRIKNLSFWGNDLIAARLEALMAAPRE